MNSIVELLEGYIDLSMDLCSLLPVVCSYAFVMGGERAVRMVGLQDIVFLDPESDECFYLWS